MVISKYVFQQETEDPGAKTIMTLLNKTINQIALRATYRAFPKRMSWFPFYSPTHGIFSIIYDNLGHNVSLKTYINADIILCILWYHNEMTYQSVAKNLQKTNKQRD